MFQNEQIPKRRKIGERSRDLSYYEYRGDCHLSEEQKFQWEGEAIGYDQQRGRTYYKAFSFIPANGTSSVRVRCGCFLWSWIGEEWMLGRVVGCYLSNKTFTKKGKDQELQKRGHPYIWLVPLVIPKEISQKDEPWKIGGEFFLPFSRYGMYENNVDILPVWVGDLGKEIHVETPVFVFHKNSDGVAAASNACICQKAYRDSSNTIPDAFKDRQYNLLTEDAENLLRGDFLPKEWSKSLKAVQTVLASKSMNHFNRVDCGSFRKMLAQSSDDSDGDGLFTGDDSDTGEEDDDASDDCEEDEQKSRATKSSKTPAYVNEEPLPFIAASRELYDKEKNVIEKNKKDEQDMSEAVDIITKNSALHRILEQFCRNQKKLQMGLDDCATVEPYDTKVLPKDQQNIENAGKELGITHFREGQVLVCARAHWNYNVAFIAPAGHGKSLCFAIPAILCSAAPRGPGITLVVEPLKSIIDSQVAKFSKHNKVIKALGLRSTYDIQKGNNPKAKTGYEVIADISAKIRDGKSFSSNKPLLLYVTAEMAVNEIFLDYLKDINSYGKLHRIVIDEFDYAAESTEQYRQAYKNLGEIRKACSDVPFMFLSATIKGNLFLEMLDDVLDMDSLSTGENYKQLRLVVTPRLISDSLSFSVVRKRDNDQATDLMVHALRCYEKQHGEKPIAICYCLTKRNCEKMALNLCTLGIKSKVYTSANSKEEHDKTMTQFKKGQVQVVCATKALGRGVDVRNVRFIFHQTIPCSLSDYVQETGRAGRDNKQSFCIMFYRPQDRVLVESVVGISSQRRKTLNMNEKRRAEKNLDEVLDYATCGNIDKCRYARLCKYAVVIKGDSSEENKFTCKSKCDHCQVRLGEQSFFIGRNGLHSNAVPTNRLILHQVDLSTFMKKLLSKLQEEFEKHAKMNTNDITSIILNTPECEQVFKIGGYKHGLCSDLVRLLVYFKAIMFPRGMDSRIITWQKQMFLDLKDQLEENRSTFFLRKWNLIPSKDKTVTNISSSIGSPSVQNCNSTIESSSNNPCGEIDSSCGDFHDASTISSESNSPNLETTLVSESEQDSKSHLSCDSFPNKFDVSSERSFLKTETTPKKSLVEVFGRDENFSANTIKKSQIVSPPGQASKTFRKRAGRAVQNIINMPNSSCFWLAHIPFLPQFEIWRLYNNGKVTLSTLETEIKEYFIESSEKSLYSMCKKIHEVSKTAMIYRRLLECACQKELNVDQGVSPIPIITFSARLHVNEKRKVKVILETPREAPDRRIYRKFGSHRFLDIHVPREMDIFYVQAIVTSKLWIANRCWEFLWAKKAEDPQVFVFFAVEGIGIKQSEHILAESVLDWCIPSAFNPGLTIDKLNKRMKLSFSTTTPAGVLPENSLSLIDDIVNNGEVMTDGCGLISSQALDFIYSKYDAYDKKWNTLLNPDDSYNEHEVEKINTEDTVEVTECPLTSFQGRIGGFKGMWVLDPSLEGFTVLCRKSQLKYNLPMKSFAESVQGSTNATYDDAYDTVDICEFDCKKNEEREASLNVRAIQVLEHRGVSYDYFRERVDRGISEVVSTYSGDNNQKLLLHLKKQDTWKTNPTLWQMCTAQVEKDEFSFASMRCNGLKGDLQQIHKKARYPVPQCYFFRMMPDHTGVLSENEVYITRKTSSEYLIAMRFPTYFGSDLVKRKIVSLQAVRNRCKDVKKMAFFQENQHCILFSTKGSRSPADIMSGGDYDGDTAWVCLNESLVNQVQDCPATEKIQPPEKNEVQMQAIVPGVEGRLKMVEYIRHYIYHKRQLGKLATDLDAVMDKFGVDSSEAKVVARYSFLQVDHPYELQELTTEEKDLISNCSTPHWKKSLWGSEDNNHFYHSTAALGKIYDHIMSNFPISDLEKGQCSKVITQCLRDEENEIAKHSLVHRRTYLLSLKDKMESAILEYNINFSEKIRACEKKTEDTEELDEWQERELDTYHQRLFPNPLNKNDCYLRAAVLYEQSVTLAAQKNKKPYGFAWEVARKYYGEMYNIARDNKRCRNPTSFSTESQEILLSRKRQRIKRRR
mmetsp:Transcript_15738/g.35423  ORF Transcript_15738/g.35423 Transcript_15738/m.35423 type:complete len:2029 (+) Transcript_15738:194-6280(+)